MRDWLHRLWVRRAAAAVGVWGLTLAFAVFTDRSPHVLAVAAATLAVLTIVWLCTDVFEYEHVGEWILYRAPAAGRTFDPRFSRLSQQLDEDRDRDATAVALHASLTSIADRLLLDKHGVDRLAQPAAARDILGPQASSYLDRGPLSGVDIFTPQLFDTLDTLESL
jgi:hypothetical protein